MGQCRFCRQIYASGSPDPGDVQRLIQLIEGRTVALGGASGVGKSSLVNLLRQSDVALTGDISRKLRRGRNTTRHAQLFELCGGRIIDTAGLQQLFARIFQTRRFAGSVRVFSGICAV